MTKSKVETAIDANELHLVSARGDVVAEYDQKHPKENNRPLATMAKPAGDEDVWRRDNPDLVAHRQPATLIYANQFGQAVIRQEADWNDEDDTYVFISKHHLQDVIERLQAILSE